MFERMGEVRENGWEIVSRRKKVKGHDVTGTRSAGWRLGTTFYFRNFPEECGWEELRRRLGVAGWVEDLFVPNKRDKTGGRFGFVRLSRGGSVSEMLEKLNNIWIGSFIIRAYVPKFKRQWGCLDKPKRGERETNGVTQINRRPERPTFNHKEEDESMGIRRDCRTFSETVVGKSQGESRVSTGYREDEVRFETSKEECEWFKGAFTGMLKDEFSWSEHGEELRNECMGNLCLTSLGGKMILIRSLSLLATEEILGGYREWADFWFKWRRPWTQSDVNSNREVWTRWTGVPIQAWCERFFVIGSAQVGCWMEMHEITRSRQRLDEAYIKILTGLISADRVIKCWIDDVAFPIRVEEIGAPEFLPSNSQLWKGESDLELDVPRMTSENWTDDCSVEAAVGWGSGKIAGDEETVNGGIDGSLPSLDLECADMGSLQKEIVTYDKDTLNGENANRNVEERENCSKCSDSDKVGPLNQVSDGPSSPLMPSVVNETQGSSDQDLELIGDQTSLINGNKEDGENSERLSRPDGENGEKRRDGPSKKQRKKKERARNGVYKTKQWTGFIQGMDSNGKDKPSECAVSGVSRLGSIENNLAEFVGRKAGSLGKN